MPTVNDEPLMGKEEHRNLYEEADKLLRLAEGLQDKCEHYERGLWLVLATGASITAALATLAVYLTFRPPSEGWGYIWAGIAYLYAFSAGTYLYFMRERIRQR